MSLSSPVASMLAIIAWFALLWQALVQLSGKEGTEKYCYRQLPALELPIELQFGPNSPSCLREFFLAVCEWRFPASAQHVQFQKQLQRGLVAVLPISIFNSCLSTMLIYFVFRHLLEEVDSAAIIFLSLLTSLHGFVTICSHEAWNESWGDRG